MINSNVLTRTLWNIVKNNPIDSTRLKINQNAKPNQSNFTVINKYNQKDDQAKITTNQIGPNDPLCIPFSFHLFDLS